MNRLKNIFVLLACSLFMISPCYAEGDELLVNNEEEVIIERKTEEEEEIEIQEGDKPSEEVEEDVKNKEGENLSITTKTLKAFEKIKPTKEIKKSFNPLYTIEQFEYLGIIYYKGYKFSYYSERVLPGKGLRIPGRHTKDGFVRDKDEYIVSAIKGKKGKIFDTPFGKTKVYDYCSNCSTNHIDLYTR